MIKKLVKVAAVVGVGYLVYNEYNKHAKNFIKVEDIPTEDVLEMLKEKGFKLLCGNESKVLHFIKDDKSEAIQARLNEVDEVFLIEYYQKNDGVKTLENVYPKNVVLDNENAKKARSSFLRMLGSMGLTEKRFNKLVVEVLKNPHLADLSI